MTRKQQHRDGRRIAGAALLSWLVLGSALPAMGEMLDGAVRVAADVESPVWAGQQVTVNLDLMSTGFSFSDQQFLLPEVEGGFLLQTDSTTVKLTEQRDGQTWQVLRYPIALFAQRAGSVTVPGFEVRFRASAGYGQAPRQFAYRTRPVTLQVQRPPGIEEDGLVVTTTAFAAEALWSPSAAGDPAVPTPVQPGDAVSLTVTLRAADVSGMFLPQLPVASPAGLSAYPELPVVADRVDRGRLQGSRVEKVTWVFAQPGAYEFPELRYRWFDPQAGLVREHLLPGRRFEVAAAPAAPAVGTGGVRERTLASRWGYAAAGVIALVAALALLARRWLTRRRATAATAAPGERRLYRAVLRACRAGDPAAAYAATLAWAALRAGRPVTLGAFAAASQPAFRDEAEALQRAVIAGAGSERWNGAALAAKLRALRRRQPARGRGAAALAPLNPGSPPSRGRGGRGCSGSWSLLLLCLLAPLLVTVPQHASADPAVGPTADFVGTQRCATCHVPQHEAWQGSHHDLAMQHAGADTVLGDFDEARFTYAGVTSTFMRRGDRFFVRTDGADGKLAEFEIRYTFGVSPLQQYLVEFPDGRVQALGIAWDSRPAAQGGQRWFHLYPDQAVTSDHELHWTRPQQNWNHMCADCHSTNLQKGYDAARDRFETRWSELDVGCEACHGPGGRHVQWASGAPSARDQDPRKGLTVSLPAVSARTWTVDPSTGSARPGAGPVTGEVEVCADCHSRRGIIAGDKERHARFLDNYMPAFLTDGLYHPDGQILDEVFVWGSFGQSRMHQAGVSCGDCHDPHSLSLRAPGDAVCATCHAPTRFAASSHHGHPQDSLGSSCIDCHMPETTYMVVDPRRDHSIRIPRPDLTRTLGVPNACNRCHQDRDAAWAAEQTARWHGAQPVGQQTWADAFAAARAGDPRAEGALAALVGDPDTPDIARATALLELRAFLSPSSADALQRSLADPNPLLRIAALRGLEALPPSQRHRFAAPLLQDPLRAVRIEAGRVLAAVPEATLTTGEALALRRALGEYVQSQELNADRADARTNLGNFFQQRGDLVRAEREFRRAIALDPLFPASYVNLADLYRLQRKDQAAADVLAQGLERLPETAALHHALGLLRVRSGDTDAALSALASAARLDPEEARFSYVYAVALNSAGRADAVDVLQQALQRHPYDRDMLFALVTMLRDGGRLGEAQAIARRMLEIRPQDAEARALLGTLR